MGRPKKVDVRIENSIEEFLDKFCDVTEMNRSEAIRYCINFTRTQMNLEQMPDVGYATIKEALEKTKGRE